MTEIEHLERLISECSAKEGRRFASNQAAMEFDNLYDQIERLVMNNNSNKEIMKKAASYSPMLLRFASEELRKDPEIILFALNTPSVAEYINNFNFDPTVLQAVREELSKRSQEEKKWYYALDGSKFETVEEALFHNENLFDRVPK